MKVSEISQFKHYLKISKIQITYFISGWIIHIIIELPKKLRCWYIYLRNWNYLLMIWNLVHNPIILCWFMFLDHSDQQNSKIDDLDHEVIPICRIQKPSKINFCIQALPSARLPVNMPSYFIPHNHPVNQPLQTETFVFLSNPQQSQDSQILILKL